MSESSPDRWSEARRRGAPGVDGWGWRGVSRWFSEEEVERREAARCLRLPLLAFPGRGPCDGRPSLGTREIDLLLKRKEKQRLLLPAAMLQKAVKKTFLIEI